jgi:HPt (histidine-containing phosphotransfer) domain-containing protein
MLSVALVVSANLWVPNMPFNKSIDCSPGSGTSDLLVLPAALRQLQECGETTLVEELIVIFESDTASRLEVLARALATADNATARQEAHTIKGSALQVGAVPFAEACRQMEMEARKEAPSDLADLYRTMLQRFDEVRGAIAARRWIEADGPSHNGQ